MFDLSFGRHGAQELTLGTGKQVRYLGFEEWRTACSTLAGKHVYVRNDSLHYDTATDRVYLDVLVADPVATRSYIEAEASLLAMITEKLGDNAAILLGSALPIKPEWVRIEEVKLSDSTGIPG